jgi:hypothetical protein
MTGEWRAITEDWTINLIVVAACCVLLWWLIWLVPLLLRALLWLFGWLAIVVVAVVSWLVLWGLFAVDWAVGLMAGKRRGSATMTKPPLPLRRLLPGERKKRW